MIFRKLYRTKEKTLFHHLFVYNGQYNTLNQLFKPRNNVDFPNGEMLSVMPIGFSCCACAIQRRKEKAHE